MTKNGRVRIRGILWIKQAGLCCYCAIPMVRAEEDIRVAANQLGIRCCEVDSRRASFEHLRRKCEGGTDAIDNLALACRDCNVKRGDRDWMTYKSICLGELDMEAA